jgi:uncharacterized BrkB/YihY/UPF0761 family membrane protein
VERTFRINAVPFVIVLVVGFGTLTKFAPNVRAVDAVGLSGAGCALGVGLFGVVMAIATRRKV